MGNEGFQFLKAHFWKWQGPFPSVLLVGAVANSTPSEGEGKEVPSHSGSRAKEFVSIFNLSSVSRAAILTL